MPKTHVLMAARRSAHDLLRGYLESSAELIPADTLDQALRALEKRHDIDLVFITVNFDESRMFDLLRLSAAKYPEIPVVCCRAFDHDGAKISVEALDIASEALGAAAFIDVPAIKKRVGKERLAGEFRKAVFQHLRNAK